MAAISIDSSAFVSALEKLAAVEIPEKLAPSVLSLLHFQSDALRIESTTTASADVRLLLKPSDGLIELLSAVRACEGNQPIIEVAHSDDALRK
jgi:hypothetical protein